MKRQTKVDSSGQEYVVERDGRVGRKRPIVQPEPKPGQLYEWDSSPAQLFLILGLAKKYRDVWRMRALDLQKGCETEIGVRRRDRFNGWRQVALEAPF